jgi:hypothetical protein
MSISQVPRRLSTPSIGMTVSIALTNSNAFLSFGNHMGGSLLPFERIVCASLNPIKDKDRGAWELKPFYFPCFHFVEPSRCLSLSLMPTTNSPSTVLKVLI